VIHGSNAVALNGYIEQPTLVAARIDNFTVFDQQIELHVNSPEER
jgi:hypothetical protein